MKIVIGHKDLNLEELFQIACMPAFAELVIDSVTNAEFALTIPGGANKEGQTVPEIPDRLIPSIRAEHERAILLVKILQIVKLKRGATKPNVDFLVGIINQNKSFLVSLYYLVSFFAYIGRRSELLQGTFPICEGLEYLFLRERTLHPG